MDTSGTNSAVATPPKRGWRRHSEEFRARVIELARRPNTSVAAVALANGLNANMLRRWVRDFEVAGKAADEVASPRDAATALPSFVQLPMHTPPSPPTASPEQTAVRVEVEIHRNGTTVRANLPVDSHSAAWLREVMG
jgi:transposase-like protein